MSSSVPPIIYMHTQHSMTYVPLMQLSEHKAGASRLHEEQIWAVCCALHYDALKQKKKSLPVAEPLITRSFLSGCCRQKPHPSSSLFLPRASTSSANYSLPPTEWEGLWILEGKWNLKHHGSDPTFSLGQASPWFSSWCSACNLLVRSHQSSRDPVGSNYCPL